VAFAWASHPTLKQFLWHCYGAVLRSPSLVYEMAVCLPMELAVRPAPLLVSGAGMWSCFATACVVSRDRLEDAAACAGAGLFLRAWAPDAVQVCSIW